MKKLKIYLDNCALNRPFDDQSNLMVRLESEAKLSIQELVKEGAIDLVWSFVLDYENANNPFQDKQERIGQWKYLAKDDCVLTDEIRATAHKLLYLGLKQVDASHIACSIAANVDYFITTDKGILKKHLDRIKIVNPIIFMEEYTNEN
jgi:predicted nucleic acid-binding protein